MQDELRVIVSADITQMDVLKGILSKYVMGGMTQGKLWTKQYITGFLVCNPEDEGKSGILMFQCNREVLGERMGEKSVQKKQYILEKREMFSWKKDLERYHERHCRSL